MFGRETITLGIAPHSSYDNIMTLVMTRVARVTNVHLRILDINTKHKTRNVGQCPT